VVSRLWLDLELQLDLWRSPALAAAAGAGLLWWGLQLNMSERIVYSSVGLFLDIVAALVLAGAARMVTLPIEEPSTPALQSAKAPTEGSTAEEAEEAEEAEDPNAKDSPGNYG
jgi:hypothetical protein